MGEVRDGLRFILKEKIEVQVEHRADGNDYI